MFIKKRLIALSILLSFACTPIHAAGGDVERAVALYKKGDMAGCATILRAACASSSANNPVAHYYLANSLVALRRTAEARTHYEAVLKLVPSGPFHDQTVNALRSIGATVPTTSPATSGSTAGGETSKGAKRGFLGLSLIHGNEVDQVVPKSPAAEAGIQPGDFIVTIDGNSTTNRDVRYISSLLMGLEGTDVTIEFDHAGKRNRAKLTRRSSVDIKSVMGVRANTTTRTADNIDKSMVTTLRQTPDTKEVYQEVIQAMAAIPKHVKEDLERREVKVIIAPSITDARPDLKGVRPEAYVHGGDYENCPGMYDHGHKTLYIAERCQIGSSPKVINSRALEVTLHELGHAFDYAHSYVQSAEYRKACEQDSAHLNNTLRERFYYYTQEGRGPTELFAELFATANGSRDTPGLDRAFPRSLEFIKSKMNER